MKKNQIMLGIVAVVVIALFAYGIGRSSYSAVSIKTVASSTAVASPERQASQSSVDAQFQCSQLGRTAQKDYEAKYPDNMHIQDSVFHYNTRLHECLWGRSIYGGESPGQPFTVFQGITNLFSNKDILYVFKFYSGDKIPKLTNFEAINYIDYPNQEGGGVIKDETVFDALYNKTLTE